MLRISVRGYGLPVVRVCGRTIGRIGVFPIDSVVGGHLANLNLPTSDPGLASLLRTRTFTSET
jgi:hypothetical protein